MLYVLDLSRNHDKMVTQEEILAGSGYNTSEKFKYLPFSEELLFYKRESEKLC